MLDDLPLSHAGVSGPHRDFFQFEPRPLPLVPSPTPRMLTSLPVLLGIALLISQGVANTLQRRDLQSCLFSAGLLPITNTSPAYSADVLAYNSRFQPNPVAIIYPSSASDVAAAVGCASSLSFSGVSAKGGGHSCALHSPYRLPR